MARSTANSTPVVTELAMPAAFNDRREDPAQILGNPLRNLRPSRVASLLEQGDRGEWTQVQWLMRYVERLDPDMSAICQRRRAAVGELSWGVRIACEKAERMGLEALAEEQKTALMDYYESLENLQQAVEFAETAIFRGFSHLGISADSARLEPLDQWWWLRYGAYGNWCMNHDLMLTSARAAAAERMVADDHPQWIIMEEEYPVLWIAILKYLRANQSQKWWDAFCEVFSRRGTVIVGPPDLPADKFPQFRTDAENVARGGSGAVPNGTTVLATNAIQGAGMPYKDHMAYLRETLVLAGTGGMLTMITAPTGLGSGVGDQHGDAFAKLARRDARRISEAFQRKLDKPRLARLFPGQPILAYWQLDTDEKQTPEAAADLALKLNQAAYVVDIEELSERTGLTLTVKAPPPPPVMPTGALPLGTPPGGEPPPGPGTAEDAVSSAAAAEKTADLSNGRSGGGAPPSSGGRGAEPHAIRNAGNALSAVPAQADLKALEELALREFGSAYADALQPFFKAAAEAGNWDGVQAALQAGAFDPAVKARMADVITRTSFAAVLRGQAPLNATIQLQPLPFKEAQAFWKDKLPVADFAQFADATWAQSVRYGFKVAGITEQSALSQIKDAIGTAIDGQTTVDQFVREAQARFGMNAAHAETVIRTNVQSAYQWGHYQQLKAVQGLMPIWAWDVVEDSGTSATCRGLIGKAAPANSPVWDSLYPPNHYNCRTTVIAFENEEEAAADGFTVLKSGEWPRDPATGAQVMAGAGFGINLGTVPTLDGLLADIGGEPSLVNRLLMERAGDVLLNGDFPGHPYRGNQYEEGGASFHTDSLGRWPKSKGQTLSVKDNISRGKKAMTRALKGEDVQKAMHRPELGQIDFWQGTPGIRAKDWKKGGGVRHILAKHPQDAMKIPEAIAKRKITVDPEDNAKRIIDHEGVLVALKKENTRKSWVISGYKPRR